MSLPPPPTTIYVVATDGYYYSRRDWRGSDIAFVTLTGVFLLITLTCLFADCYYPQHDRRRRSTEPYEQERDEAWAYERRRPPSSDFL